MINIAANKYGDYRNLDGAMSPYYEVVPIAAGLSGLALPWAFRLLERKRESGKKDSSQPN